MKRNIIYTAACLVAFASCQKQEVAEAPSQVEVAVELTASAAADATKTVMTEYNAHWWSVSDKISLFYTVEGKTGHSVFTSKNYIPAASAKFAGSLSLPAEDTDLTTVSALAVYPATTADASDGTSVNVTVPSVQTAVEGSFMEGAYPVVAKTSDLTAALSFKAVCGGVKVSFQTPGITSFTFDAKGAKIAGKASVTFDTAGNPVAKPDESAVSVITVNAPAGGFEVGKWYYMTALPATISGGYKITLHGGEADGTELAGSSDITIKRSVFGVLDSKDAPYKYADLKANLKPISWWDENKETTLDPKPAYTGTDREYDRTQANKNSNMIITSVKFISDASYVYGYFEGTGTDISRLKNLGLWLDVDGNQKGEQGGDWLFTLYKYYDKIARGSIGADGNMEWNPSLYESPKGSSWLGSKVATPSQVAYGSGTYENSVFKYSVIIDRRALGVRNNSSMVIGINFDDNKSTGIGNFTNPDRGGYVVTLKNSDMVTIDETTILNHIKSVNMWSGIPYTKITNPGNNRGDTKLKFDSDADYIYGYIEIPNTDNLCFKNGEYYEFCPGFIKNLAIGFDLDGIENGQGMCATTGECWEIVLNGDMITYNRPLSDTDKANGWSDRWGHYIFPASSFHKETTVRPNYTITPKVWNPQITVGKKNVIGEVLAGTEGWSNVAIGSGEWNDKTFKYSFTIDRVRIGLKGLSEVKLIVHMYEVNIHDGYTNTPDAAGTTLKLNN